MRRAQAGLHQHRHQHQHQHQRQRLNLRLRPRLRLYLACVVYLSFLALVDGRWVREYGPKSNFSANADMVRSNANLSTDDQMGQVSV